MLEGWNVDCILISLYRTCISIFDGNKWILFVWSSHRRPAKREREERKDKHLIPTLYVNVLNRQVLENDGVSLV